MPLFRQCSANYKNITSGPYQCISGGVGNASIVVLLGKVGELQGLCEKLKRTHFGKQPTAEHFQEANWLLAYEGSMQGWFGWNAAMIKGSILEPLANAGVSFLDLKTSVPSLIKIKQTFDGELDDIEFDELDEYFEPSVESDAYDSMSDDDDDELLQDDDEGGEVDREDRDEANEDPFKDLL